MASVNGHAPVFSRTLETLLEQPWDVVQLEHSYMYEPCRGPLQQHAAGFLLSEHNVEATLAEVTYSRLPAVFRPLARLDRWRYQRWERQVVGAARKVVIFTESRRTQDYLARFLEAHGYAGKVVTFSGTNNTQSATGIYQRWLAKYSGSDRVTGSPADTRGG